MYVEQLKSNKIGRNELCPCGSRIKYKFCCLKKVQEFEKAQKEKNLSK